MSNKFADLGFEPVETVDAFDSAFERTLGFEGGNTVDHAGPTNLGITQDTYDNWRKKNGLPTKKVKDINVDEAKELYRKEYFDNPGFSKLPANVASVLFDYGVNAGTPRAAMSLQKAVGASPDGVIGPKTLNKVNEFVSKNGEQPLLQSIVDQRAKHNDTLIKKNPAKYKKFENGWKNRIKAIKSEFKLSDLNPFAVTEASAGEVPQNDFTDLGFEEAATPTETFDDLGFQPEQSIPQLSASKNFDKSVPLPEKMEATPADFDFFTQNLADKLATASSGQTVPEMIESKNKLSGIIMRAPMLAMAPVAPIASTVVEGLNQAKNLVVSSVKKEKYSPIEIRVLNELLPKETPTAVRIAAMGGEALTDVALLGGLSNLAKQGLLKDTIKEIGMKLERAGYGTGQKTINMDVVKEAARGSTLDLEAERWLKAKLGDVKPKNNIGTTTPEKPVAGIAEPTVAHKSSTSVEPVQPTPATPVERAAQHGEVVGIDAKSGLPVIDTSVKPSVKTDTYTGQDRRSSDMIPQPSTPKNRLSDWTPILDAYDTAEGKKYQINKLDVSDTVKGKLLDHYGLLFDKPVVAAQTSTPTILPKPEEALAPSTENIRPIKVVSKSVQDHTQSVKIDKGIITVTNRQGRNIIGNYEIPISKWEELDKSFGNPNYNKKEFINKINKEKFPGNYTEERMGEPFISRIEDSQISAINEAFTKYKQGGDLYGKSQEAGQKGNEEKVLIPQGQKVETPKAPVSKNGTALKASLDKELIKTTDTVNDGKAPATPLHTEALKYKTAEEFVASRKLEVVKPSEDIGVFSKPEHFDSGDSGIGNKIEQPSKDRPLLQGSGHGSVVYRDASGKPQGVLTFQLKKDGAIETNPDNGASVEVFVNPEYRRQGIATKLYDKAKELGFDIITVEGRVFTKDGLELQKSQLTAIYNEAHGQKVGRATAEKPTNNLKEYVDSLPSGPINITRDEIYSKFDNALKPIAEIPQKYVKYLSASSNEVFSGKAYFIDHHINHHPTTTREDYLTIPEVLKNPDEVKQNLKEGKKGLVFIKKFDKYHAAVVSLDVENGKIILHKTFFTQTKKPYKKLPLVELEGEGGNSSISQAVKPPAESVSARPSDMNIPQNPKDVNPASLKPPTVSQVKAAASPQALEQRIEQLNKFGQANAILRRTASLRQAAGRYSPKENTIKIDEETITSNSSYMEVLGHELGHAIEKNVTGKIQQITSGKKGFELFGDNVDQAKIRTELEAVTEYLVGKARMDGKPEYFYQSTELIARFFEKMVFSPGNLTDLAPTAVDAIELQSIKHPIIQEFLMAATGTIDKGTPKFALLRDMRETYQKHLGKFVGNRAYDQEMVYRAMKERGKIVIEKFIKDKMKMVKDSPESLFRAAESIKISRGGVPEFGTRDFATAHSAEEEKALIDAGYERLNFITAEDGKLYTQYAKQRYTPDEAKLIFDSLSDNGKKLIVDFTAERKEAKDFFNREVIKETYKIQSQLEGWVHHYFEDRTGSTVVGGQKFKQKIAGSRKQRTGTEGYVEDFKKAMTKALVDLEGEKVYNEFIPKLLATVTKPLGKGQEPDAGWVEVVGNLKSGVGLPIEKRATVIDSATGERVPMTQSRYQMPKEIYERYKMWRGLIDEATTAVRIVNDLNRYWRINILAHPGTSVTNFVSGGIQFSSKILTDFYREVLTGKLSMPDTKSNISAMLKVLLPKGWMDAPDWVYGSDLSNFYGEFMKKKSPISESIDTYGNKALVLFGAVERYWKKVIMTADGVADLKSLNEMTPEGLRVPTKEEAEMIAAINESVDLYGYDYDNVPQWLEQHQKSVVGQAIKPFAKYPYKYAKQILNMVGGAFDQSIPVKDRMAKILALATIVSAYAAFANERRKKQKTPVADKSLDIPARLQTRGRVLITTDEKGREIFVRVAKYPFLNLTEAGMQFVDGNWQTGTDVLSDMLGSIGPAASVGLMAFNYRSKYNQYEKPEVILGDNLATFLPGYRILNDVSRALDPFQRKQETFGQTFTQIIPTTDQALQEKLHGKIRTERVPIEGNVGLEPVGSRTTVDVPLENVKEDILLSLFTGVYRTRLDPKVVEAYIIRKQKNLDKKNAKK